MNGTAGCFFCAEGWEHCHDAAVEHADGSVECTGESGCHLLPDVHEVTVPCTEVMSRCGCGVEE